MGPILISVMLENRPEYFGGSKCRHNNNSFAFSMGDFFFSFFFSTNLATIFESIQFLTYFQDFQFQMLEIYPLRKICYWRWTIKTFCLSLSAKVFHVLTIFILVQMLLQDLWSFGFILQFFLPVFRDMFTFKIRSDNLL